MNIMEEIDVLTEEYVEHNEFECQYEYDSSFRMKSGKVLSSISE